MSKSRQPVRRDDDTFTPTLPRPAATRFEETRVALRQTTVLPAGTGALRATFRAFGLHASHGRDDEGLRVLRVSPDAFEIEYDAPAGEVRPFDERRAEIRGAFLRACASLSGMGYALRIVVSPRRLVAYVDASELRPPSQAASSRG